MPKRLMLVNAALVAVAAVCALYVARQLLTPTPLPPSGRSPAPSASAAPPPPPRLEAGAYGVVASRNLFSPMRSDTQLAARDSAAAVPMLKPILHGVVLREDAPVAYLEDPSVKRVAGYRIGDSIVGGTVQRIAADHVVINRPEGAVDVRLRDPAKPRPVAAAGASSSDGTPAGEGGEPPAVAVPTPSIQPAPPAAGPLPMQPGRRPFPLLRRVPPGVQGDAPRQ
jgi:hypothetical protein